MFNSQVLLDTHISLKIKCDPDYQSSKEKKPLQRWVCILEISSDKEGLHVQMNAFFSRKTTATKCYNTLINHLKNKQKIVSGTLQTTIYELERFIKKEYKKQLILFLIRYLNYPDYDNL